MSKRLFIVLLLGIALCQRSVAFAADNDATTAASDSAQGSFMHRTTEDAEKKADEILKKLTPEEESALEKRIKTQQQAGQNRFMISLYRPNYILPFYYTGSPYQSIYSDNTPDNQKIMHTEFKSQLSFFVPLAQHFFYRKNLSVDLAYTQLMYWQVYTRSQYFRETNYEPEIFLADHFHHNWLLEAGVDHQSNGRGGGLERSWNRAIVAAEVSGGHWVAGLRTWALIFQGGSSNLHNPDIAHYLGHENLLLAYKIRQLTLSLQLQNIESALSRGFVEVAASYPLTHHLLFYTQYFNGYGQSLIEYNHRTHSIGVGFAFNDWI